MTLKEMVKQVIQELVKEGKTEFTSGEVYDRLSKKEPEINTRSLYSLLHALSKGSKNPIYTAEEKCLTKIKRGVYQYSIKEKKGLWW
jgi:hypothetical protein